MAKKKATRSKVASNAKDYPPFPAGPIRAAEPGPVTFGGSLIREMGSLPGMLGKFVTLSRQYDRETFLLNREAMSQAFSHLNAEPLVDDYGKEWPPGSLVHLGSDGRDEGNDVFLVHKFIPVAGLYSVKSFGWAEKGRKF